jgi:hypothetical protein
VEKLNPRNFVTFAPLESPSIYAGDGRNRKHPLVTEGGVKAMPFLTGFAISNDRIYKTLEISLPDQFTEFFHTL